MLNLEEAQTKSRQCTQVGKLVLFVWHNILVRSSEIVMLLRVWGIRGIQIQNTFPMRHKCIRRQNVTKGHFIISWDQHYNVELWKAGSNHIVGTFL